MKFAIVFVALFGLALAAPAAEEAQILRSENSASADGFGYKYAVETSDGKVVSEQGELKNAGAEDAHIAVRGEFSYVGVDGVTYSVKYIADENGFQPQGAHLPVAPEA